MFMKRIAASLLPLTLLLALLLSACGGGSGGTGTGQGSAQGDNIDYSGTLTIWHSWQGDYLKVKQDIFQAYMKAHPKVTIKLVQQNDTVGKSITAIRAGSGPDIIANVDDALGKLALGRIVVPLDKYISPDYVSQTYSKPAAEAVTFNGKIYGVPESVEVITIMYNKKLVSAADLPKTTDDLVAFQKKFADQKKYGLVWNTTEPYFNAPWYYGQGATFVTEDGKVGLDTPESIQATKFIASMKPYLPSQISYDVASSLFTDGKAAAIVNGPWAYADYANKAKMDIGFATLPVISASNTPAKPFVGVKSLWVTKQCKNVALAADLLKFYTNKENQIKQAQVNGEIPANQAAAADATVQALPAIVGYAEQVKYGTALPNTPYMSALWDPIKSSLTAVWNGNQTPEAAMASAQKVAESNVAKLQS